MTTEADILGRPPIMRKPEETTEITGPSFKELCEGISAKKMPSSAIAASGSEQGAEMRQRRGGKWNA